MKNIHVLKTDKPSRLKSNKNVFDYSPAMMFIQEKDWKNQNIYITSDEEIKVGDWSFDIRGFIEKVDETYDLEVINALGKKIILTTDQDLIQDGVQAIDDEFLEWFVQNPSCEEVKTKLVEFEIDMGLGDSCIEHGSYYKIIIPKEEPKQIKCYCGHTDYCDCSPLEEPKQETLEEAVEKWIFETNGHKWSNNDDTAGDNYGSFINGAKWQQEQDKNKYSEEEVIKLLHKRDEHMNTYDKLHGGFQTPKEWFKQFKKK